MKRPLVDASSAILLVKVGLLAPLAAHYRLRMAASAFDEAAQDTYPGAPEIRQLRDAGRCELRSPTSGSRIAHSRKLPSGRGERDTILLFWQGDGDFLVIDDRAGAAFCRDQQIPYINALLVPRILYVSNRLSRATFMRATRELETIGRYAEWVLQAAATVSLDCLAAFLPETMPP